MTSITNIKTSESVVLPGWCGEAFECELRRPSLLALAAKGAITNPLMKTARKIFYSGFVGDGDLADEGRVLTEIAKAALVKPTFAEMAENGIELTDEQLIAIYNYTQKGARALEQFRELATGNDDNRDGAAVSDAAE